MIRTYVAKFFISDWQNAFDILVSCSVVIEQTPVVQAIAEL